MTARLTEQIRTQLAAIGRAEATRSGLPVPAEQWRECALSAGTQLGRPVRVVEIDSALIAIVTDWPSTQSESDSTLENLRP